MNKDYPIRIDYGMSAYDIVLAISRELGKHGLLIETDNDDHDGFELYRITEAK